MKTILTITLAAFFGTLMGCTPTVTRGATAIFPEQTADSASAWVYIEASDSAKSGVYRCVDREGQAMCLRAPLVHGK